MTSSRIFLAILVTLGSVITQSSALPKLYGRVERAAKDPANGGETGTAEDIKAKPEETKPYLNWGNTNFQGVQNIMDGHFMKKKKEGDQITKYGDHSRKENEVMQTKVEENQYNTMYHSFKWAEGEMNDSAKEAAKSDDDADGSSGTETESVGAPTKEDVPPAEDAPEEAETDK